MSQGRPEPTAIYDKRAFARGATSLNVVYDEICKLPGAPFPHPLSDANTLRFQVCLYVIGALRSATEKGAAAQRAWFGGQFLAAPVLIHMFIELWGAVAYAEQLRIALVAKGRRALSSAVGKTMQTAYRIANIPPRMFLIWSNASAA